MTAEQQKLFGIEKLNVPRSDIPAVTHVDYSARVQTVHRETNPRYHALLERFHERTGCPVIVDTSFNVRGEPIVGTPEDAFRCSRRGQLPLAKRRPGPQTQPGLQICLRAGLRHARMNSSRSARH
jgi:carbamoyltransferase